MIQEIKEYEEVILRDLGGVIQEIKEYKEVITSDISPDKDNDGAHG